MTDPKSSVLAPPEPAAPASTLDFWAGFWRLADPKITLASMAASEYPASRNLITSWTERGEAGAGGVVEEAYGFSNAQPPQRRDKTREPQKDAYRLLGLMMEMEQALCHGKAAFATRRSCEDPRRIPGIPQGRSLPTACEVSPLLGISEAPRGRSATGNARSLLRAPARPHSRDRREGR